MKDRFRKQRPRPQKRSETKSKRLFERARKSLVGGVNSPVRSFGSVGRNNPLFISRARGSKIYDEDQNEYLDYVCSWGALILGSAHPSVIRSVRQAVQEGSSFGAATKREVELAERIKRAVPSIQLVRMVSSGTEATMSAIRVARAFTRRSKIVKFDGCYHGHADPFLVKAGSGLATYSLADSAGVPRAVASETLVARFNDLESVNRVISANQSEVAAIIVEPVAGNMGVVPPDPGFLEGLERICDQQGTLLIFDEVITGFRVSLRGAQGVYKIKPDLTCLGKVIGGGMNIGAYGGREDIMQLVSPIGPVYQAGTLAGNPLATSAGLATLDLLRDSVYEKLEANSKKLASELTRISEEAGVELKIQRVGSMLGLFFLTSEEEKTEIRNNDDIKNFCDKQSYSLFFNKMLESGVYLPPSPFETIFLSAAHSELDIEKTLRAADLALAEVSKMKKSAEPKSS